MEPFGSITNSKILLRASVLSLLAIWCLASCSRKKDERPNVMIIFPDQYRQFSLGFWSQDDHSKYLQGAPDPVHTPALDRLANQGVVFSRAVSNFPLCSPFRGMLMSGMYPDQNGLTTNCRSDRELSLREDIECVTDVYAKAGYNVAYFGKCHWQKTEPLFDENGNYTGSTSSPGGHYVNRYDTYVPPGKPRHGIDYFFQALKDDLHALFKDVKDRFPVDTGTFHGNMIATFRLQPVLTSQKGSCHGRKGLKGLLGLLIGLTYYQTSNDVLLVDINATASVDYGFHTLAPL